MAVSREAIPEVDGKSNRTGDADTQSRPSRWISIISEALVTILAVV